MEHRPPGLRAQRSCTPLKREIAGFKNTLGTQATGLCSECIGHDSLHDNVSPVAVRAYAVFVQILLCHVHSEKQNRDQTEIQY